MKSHILFVDDEAPIRELLSLFFRKKGLQVTTATTAQEAKDCAARGGFHLAILDLNLAGENGMELLADFKTRLPQMPVIIFTGLAGEDLVEQARARGADGFMRKTESLGTLYEEVCRHLPAD
ncbi:MAG TPA: response regulator [Candidatus Binatia bacterium]|jgi:DNA-binding NtrC family response regulator|nr:response regulator [Candidatus Binatia bacterium]